MMTKLPFPRRQRVLMLTTDGIIDRRILHEGKSLSEAGYEVVLLAACQKGINDFEVIDQIKVHRIPLDILDPRLARVMNFLDAVGRSIRECFPWRPLRAVSKLCRGIARGEKWLAWKPLRRPWQWTAKACRRVVFSQQLLVWWSLRMYAKVSRRLSRRLASGLFFLSRLLARCGDLNSVEYLYYREGLRYRPDVVHVHDLPMLTVGARLKAELNAPLVYDMHETYPDQPRLTARQKRKLLRTEGRHVGSADVVFTVNDLLLDFIRRRYDLVSSGVVQNAVSAPHFRPQARHDRFREDYPQLRGKLLVLYQGWIAPERNLETAIKAMAHVTRPEVTLLIMGYGDYADDLRRLAEAEGVQDRVVFVPSKTQQELLSYSASADVGLIPYPTDRDVNTRLVSPNKLYEFITARLPILTNQLPFVRSVVEKWQFGEVADLGDPQSFARALDRLDRDRLAVYREHLKRDSWRFDWEQEQQKLLAIYDGLPSACQPVPVETRVAS